MENTIIMTSCLFGSVYIFAKSLELLNQSIIINYNYPVLYYLNGISLVLSGSIIRGFYIHLLAKT